MPAFDDETAYTPTSTPRPCDATGRLFEARAKLAIVRVAAENFETKDGPGLDADGVRLLVGEIASALEAVQAKLDQQATLGRLNCEASGIAATPESLRNFSRCKADLDAARRDVEAAKTDDEADAAQLIYRGLLDSFFATPAADADELAEKWRVIERELHDALFEGERSGTPELAWLAALKADYLRLARR